MRKRDKIFDKITQGIELGLTDLEIDRAFQRHVTKAELVGLVRHLIRRTDKKCQDES